MIVPRTPIEMEFSERKERAFPLALTALVRGRDIRNRDFAAETRLSSLSAQEATLPLRRRVRVGSKLVISFSVPKTAFLGRPVHLALSGTVSRVIGESGGNGSDRLITLRLDRNYKISATGI
jgi:hypothetical protein